MAELACGHTQHVRHTPPWQVRPWVVTASGRAQRVGTPLACALCDAAAGAGKSCASPVVRGGGRSDTAEGGLRHSTLSIREHVAADDAGIRACLAELQDLMREIEPRVAASGAVIDRYLAHLRDRCRRECGTFFVGLDAGEIAGCVAVLARVPMDEPDEESYEYAFVTDLVVRKPWRGRGLGAALLARAEAWAAAQGATLLRVAVLAGNTGARRLYDRLGFREREITCEKAIEPADRE